MFKRLFFKLLPVQILILAMGSINSIVDGAVAGRFIDAESVGVIGLYFTMVNVLAAVGSVLLGGSSILCGRYMGRGDIEKTDSLLLRIKDDCIPFDPKERASQLSSERPEKNIGIRMVMKLADDIIYQNNLGLNVLTIRFPAI